MLVRNAQLDLRGDLNTSTPCTFSASVNQTNAPYSFPEGAPEAGEDNVVTIIQVCCQRSATISRMLMDIPFQDHTGNDGDPAGMS